ncbi:MAG: bile acid:sodium symporter family protein [Bacteroidales bacterium]|nr:bile acid:sodium symporter family protein [Bacteroidales bacterium]
MLIERKKMQTVEKICQYIAKYMAIIVLIVAAIALWQPQTFTWIKPTSINYLLGVVMFGMGLTLKTEDFKIVFSRPKEVLIGFVAQFTLMPLIAFLLIKIFALPTELAIGVMLVGTCPGGTASNVITYIAKGDVALSVGMTIVSTIFAPFLTPLFTKIYIGEVVDVNILDMFFSIVKVVLIPIILGILVNKFFEKFTQKIVKILPAVSSLVIVAIVAAVVSASSEKLLNALSTSTLIIFVVILHNICGYAAGYGVGKLLKLQAPKCCALSIEVGMQNSGLAAGLAAAHFAQYPLATIPGAVFSTWHNISGAIYAAWLRHRGKK